MAMETAIACTRFPDGTFRKSVAAGRSPALGGHSEGVPHQRVPVMDETLTAYLQALAGGAPDSAYLELRYRVARNTLAADFLPAHDTRALAESISRRASRTDVYVGCAPRCRRSGTKRDVDRVWVLWAECDGPDAARAALAYDPRPSIVIASGSGPNLHAYWPLRFGLPSRAAEHANLRLAEALGANRACYDAARILRPPGTWNHKGQPPAPVRALRMDRRIAFEPEQVVARAPEIDRERVDRRWAQRGARDVTGDPLLRLSPVLYVRSLLGVDARPGRKVRCPFHTDERPSLHVYPTAARGWSCFSCGRGGSIYDLAAAVWGTSTRGRDFVELRRRLMERFAGELERSRLSLGR
jgi:CHC2-type zinc finger protein